MINKNINKKNYTKKLNKYNKNTKKLNKYKKNTKKFNKYKKNTKKFNKYKKNTKKFRFKGGSDLDWERINSDDIPSPTPNELKRINTDDIPDMDDIPSPTANELKRINTDDIPDMDDIPSPTPNEFKRINSDDIPDIDDILNNNIRHKITVVTNNIEGLCHIIDNSTLNNIEEFLEDDTRITTHHHRDNNVYKFLESWVEKSGRDHFSFICLQELFLKHQLSDHNLELQKVLIENPLIINSSSDLCPININQDLFDKVKSVSSYIIESINTSYLNKYNIVGPKLAFIYDGYTGGIFYDTNSWNLLEIIHIPRVGFKPDQTSPAKMCLVGHFEHKLNKNRIWIVNIHLAAPYGGDIKHKLKSLVSNRSIIQNHKLELENIIQELFNNGWNPSDSLTLLMGDFNNSDSKIDLLKDIFLSRIPLEEYGELNGGIGDTQFPAFMTCEGTGHKIVSSVSSSSKSNSYDSIIYVGNKIEAVLDNDVLTFSPDNPGSDHYGLYTQFLMKE